MSGNKRDGIYAPGSAEGVFSASEWCIGDLGLLTDEFLFYETGRSHHFGILVQAITRSPDAGVYPRVVGSQGQPPAQSGPDN